MRPDLLDSPEVRICIRKRVGRLSGGQPRNDGFGKTAQIFDQRDAQGYSERPQLSDGERLHALIRLDKVGKLLDFECAVGMRDDRPRDSEHARITGERSFGEFRQQTIESRRQIVLDVANLFVNDMEIVEQPFRRR